MAIVKQTSLVALAGQIVRRFTEGLRQRVVDYSMARLIQVGLVTKSFPYGLSFDTSSTEFRKSIGKLKTLLQKYVTKRIPYVAFSREEFLQVIGRDSFRVMISKGDFIKGELRPLSSRARVLYGDTSTDFFDSQGRPLQGVVATSRSHREIYAKDQPESKLMIRYTNYLNYLARKNHVPVRFSTVVEMTPSTEDVQAYNRESISVRRTMQIGFKTTVSVVIEIGVWHTGVRTSGEERFRAIMALAAAEDFSGFSDSTNWIFQAHNASVANFPTFYRCSAPKLFLHMDKAMKILTTLTRKVKYGSAAYSFKCE